MKPTLKWDYSQNLYAKTEWARYSAEYVQAVEVLLEKPNTAQQPLLSLPLLHLMRHALEMAFKTHVLVLKNMNGDKDAGNIPAASGDSLRNLCRDYAHQLQLLLESKRIKASARETCYQNSICLHRFYPVFDWLDSNTYGFLYPVQQDGVTKSFQKTEAVDFSDVVPVYTITLEVLRNTSAMLLSRSNWSNGTVSKTAFQQMRRAV